MSLASLHHIAVCPQMAVLPVYLLEFWNKSLEKLKVSPVNKGPECRSHLRWLWDRLLWRWNTKCPNVEDFLWRCSNQRAESFSYALGKRDLEVWASEQGDVKRQLGQPSHGHILNESAAPSLRSWNVWGQPPHGASASSVDASAIAFLGPCWLWMFGPSAPSRNCCILLYLICMLLSLLWHPSLIRDFKNEMSVVYNWSQSIFQNGWHMTSLLNWYWNLKSPVTQK